MKKLLLVCAVLVAFACMAFAAEQSDYGLAKQAMERQASGATLSKAEQTLVDTYFGSHGSSGSLDASGGPDPAYYYYVDNTGADTVQYSWIELCSDATASVVMTGGDDVSNSISLGMTFPYYGTNYTTAWASSNGMLSFNATNTAYSNSCISSTNTNSAIYVYWDDMLQVAGVAPGTCTNGALYYKNFGDYTVVEWHLFDPYSGTGLTSVECILWTSGMIKLQWNSPEYTHTSISATVGIEAPLTNGLQYLCNTAGIVGGRAVVFYRNVPQYPELGVSLLAPCGANFIGDQMLPVSFRVTNNGPVTSVPCTGYYSIDGGAQTGSAAIPAIAPAAYYDVALGNASFVIGSHTVSGWFLPHDNPSGNDSTSCAVTVIAPCPYPNVDNEQVNNIPCNVDVPTVACGAFYCGNVGAANDVDFYKIVITEPDTLKINVFANATPGYWPQGKGLDSKVTLYGPNCDSLYYNDDFNGSNGNPAGFDSGIRTICMNPGVYYVKVWGYNTSFGPYVLNVNCVPCYGPCVPDQFVTLTPNDVNFPAPQSVSACAHVAFGTVTQIVVPVSVSQNIPVVTITSGCCNDNSSQPLSAWVLGAWIYNPATTSYSATLAPADGSTGCAVCIHLDFVLPVELRTFEGVAGDNSISLSWATASETNADRFEVLRDG
ncbi:MAG TPA: hypothetical protein VGL38_14120, partial [bacterium]